MKVYQRDKMKITAERANLQNLQILIHLKHRHPSDYKQCIQKFLSSADDSSGASIGSISASCTVLNISRRLLPCLLLLLRLRKKIYNMQSQLQILSLKHVFVR